MLDLVGFDLGVDWLKVDDFYYAIFGEGVVIATYPDLKAEPLEQGAQIVKGDVCV